MNKKLLAVGIATALSMPTQADIFISEIIEGSSNNKAIEIANNGTDAVTLTGYTLTRSSNGGTSLEDLAASSSFDLSEVTIEAGDVYVIANTNANAAILAEADATTGGSPVNFNGNDPIALFIDGVAHDVAGEFGDVDWNENVTLIRTYDQTPSTEYDGSDWQNLAQDDSSNLGTISELTEEVEASAPAFDAEVTIMELQGDAEYSPYTDPESFEFTSEEIFKVTGIVTHIQSTSLGSDIPTGFFMQDASGDGDQSTSDGIFVSYSAVSNLALSEGDEVSVYGAVTESFSWTQLNAEFVESTGNQQALTATILETIDSDEDFEQTLERYEGMFIELDTNSEMKITRTFGFDFDSFRNNMVVAHGDINRQPNQQNNPGSTAAIAQTENNALNRVFIETSTEAEDGIVPWYEDFGVDNGTGTTTDYLRVGATVNGMQGFLGYSFSEFRLYVDNQLTADNFDHEGVDRSVAPIIESGDLKIATFNVLNYFNSEVGGAENPNGSNRGADNAEDLAVQTAKIVAALVALDADFVGLMEVENNGFSDNSAIVALVTALNAELDEDKQYTIASDDDYDYIGTDAITNQAIYRANKLSLDEFDVIEMPQQHAPEVTYGSSTESGDNYMRNAVTPTFTVIGTNKQLTISVNHFKSKGSVCYEDVVTGEELDDDLQGSCENFRVSGAFQLANVLAEKAGYTMIVGDLNAYASEDPLLLLTNQDSAEEGYQLKAAAYTYIGGDDVDLGEELHGAEGEILSESYNYIDTLATHEEDGFSYSFNDEVGTLDYILVDSELSELVTDAAHWNINSAESNLFQYDYDFGDVNIYNDAYRSSDHDPAIVVLDFGLEETLGETILLPSSPIDIPAQANTISTDGSFTVVVDLTKSTADSLAVGTNATVVISEQQTVRSLAGQTSTQPLTEEQIAQGWASVKVDDVSEGDITVTTYIGDELLETSNYSLTTEAEESDNDSSGGSTGLFTLLSLLGLAVWRLFRR